MNRHAPTSQPSLPVGTPVEVRNNFCAAWSRGFEVAETTNQGYRLRRRSDHYVLPAEFGTGEVRRVSGIQASSLGASVSGP
jgi:hypothetical protein